MKNRRTASADTDKHKQPRYVEIVELLLRDIRSGAFPVGGIVEPEKLLGDKFRASRGTIRQSLALLDELGIILCKQRSGTKILFRFPSKGFISADDWGPDACSPVLVRKLHDRLVQVATPARSRERVSASSTRQSP